MKYLTTVEQFEELNEDENVLKIENNGGSGLDPQATWFTVFYVDGSTEDVYVKNKDFNP